MHLTTYWSGFSQLRRRIDADVDRAIKTLGSIDEEQVKMLVRERSVDFLNELEKSENLPGFGPDDLTKCAVQYEGEYREGDRRSLRAIAH